MSIRSYHDFEHFIFLYFMSKFYNADFFMEIKLGIALLCMFYNIKCIVRVLNLQARDFASICEN